MGKENIVKPLDFVKTPKGNVALVTDVVFHTEDGYSASLAFLGGGNPYGERNAWWRAGELTVIDSLPNLLGREVSHPFGSGRKIVDEFFGLER